MLQTKMIESSLKFSIIHKSRWAARNTQTRRKTTFRINSFSSTVFVLSCVCMCFCLDGPFCHSALKLDMSILFTTFFLWTSLQFILVQSVNDLHIGERALFYTNIKTSTAIRRL